MWRHYRTDAGSVYGVVYGFTSGSLQVWEVDMEPLPKSLVVGERLSHAVSLPDVNSGCGTGHVHFLLWVFGYHLTPP